MTEDEYFRYKKNWCISLNKSGKISRQLSSCKEQHDRTERPVVPYLHTTSDVSTFKIFFNYFWFVAVGSFTADSSLLQPTGSVNTTPHTSYFLTDLHAHAWLKSCVCRARITCHDSSSCAHVFALTLFDYSTFLSLLIVFFLIILSFLLPINFIFQDVVEKFPVHSS